MVRIPIKRRAGSSARAAQQQREAAITDRIDRVVNDLRTYGVPVTRKSLSDSRLAIAAVAPRRIGAFDETRAEVRVLDRLGMQQLVIVIHLFPDSAYWQFDSAGSFEDAAGTPIEFLRVVEDPSAELELNKFDYLIGVGLSSNSPGSQRQLAIARAAVLCGSLYGSSQSGGARALGLPLGIYQGPPQLAGSAQERRQRTVLIVGIRKVAPEVSERDLLLEVLREVALPGVDLALYSGLAHGDPPTWLETRQCVPLRRI